MKFRQLLIIVILVVLGLSLGLPIQPLAMVVVLGVWLIYLFIRKDLKLSIGLTVFIPIGIYLLWFFYGLKNPGFHIDAKFHFFSILGFFIFYDWLSKERINAILNAFLALYVVIFIFYVIFNFKLLPNPYIAEEGRLMLARVEGPFILVFQIFPLIHLLYKKEINLRFWIVFIISLSTIIINGNLQNLVILLLLYFINLLSFKFILRLGLVAIVVLISGLVFVFPILPEDQQKNISELANPFESNTLQTRIGDLEIVMKSFIDDPKRVLIGEGVGVKTKIRRKNRVTNKIGEERTYLEIDNGFYYVLHRGGIVGFVLFLVFHFFLLLRQPSIRFQAGFLVFFLITNALSIHYFTDIFSTFCFVLLWKQNVAESCVN